MIRVELFARELDAFSANIARLRPDIPPDDAISHFWLTLLEASLALQRDDTDAALALLPRLLAAPEGANALATGARDNLLTWLYMHRGDYERARRVQHDNPIRLIDGVPLRGTSSGTLQGRALVGLSYAVEGRMTQAERIYRDVLREANEGGSACVDASYTRDRAAGRGAVRTRRDRGRADAAGRPRRCAGARLDSRLGAARAPHAGGRALGGRAQAGSDGLAGAPGGLQRRAGPGPAAGVQPGPAGALPPADGRRGGLPMSCCNG